MKEKKQLKKQGISLGMNPQESTSKWGLWSLIILFVAFVGLFAIISLVKPKQDFSVEENRALQELPSFDVQAFLDGDFQQEYEDYLSDQFIGRSLFVNGKTKLLLGLGQKDINGVYIGSRDYLLEKYEASDFDEDRVYYNQLCLMDFLNVMVEQVGKDHVRCMFVPSKGTALTNRLPKNARPFDTSYVINGLKEQLAENGDIVTDLTDVLQAHNEEYIYYRTDHHWTTTGAFYAYEAYMASLQQPAESLESFGLETVSEDFLGTTYDKIQIAGQKDELQRIGATNHREEFRVILDDGESVKDDYYEESYLAEKDQYSYFLGGNTAKIQIDTGVPNGKTLLLLKDSYSNSFVEYLESHYQHIYMLDLRYTVDNVYDLIDEIEESHAITDVLVLYNTEKFMKDSNLEQMETEVAE